jgi:molybdenum cofactor guanylyltransferase
MSNKFGTAVILAGGKSSRMGFDKQFVKSDDKKLVDIVAEKLRAIFSEIIIVTNKPDLYEQDEYKIISDIIPGKGPLSGIHAGLVNAESEYVYFTACDMPYISKEFVQSLKEKILGFDACVLTKGRGIEPFNAFYTKDIIPNCEFQLKGKDTSPAAMLKLVNCNYLNRNDYEFYKPEKYYFNLNTQQDLNKFLSKEEIK